MTNTMNIRSITVLLSFLISMLIFSSGDVRAEEAAPTGSMSIAFDAEKAPKGTAYMDILGKISEESEFYTPFNEKCLPQCADITAESDIALYSEEGYMSLYCTIKAVRR